MTETTVSVPGIVIATDELAKPGDLSLLAPWFNLIRAIRGVSRTGCHAVVSVRIIVDETGLPVKYSKPKCTKLEPKAAGQAFEELLDALTV